MKSPSTNRRRRFRSSRKMRSRQEEVEVTWPTPWHDPSGKVHYAHWDSHHFKPGPDALARVCARALHDEVPIEKAVRCAEAAGLFRKTRKKAFGKARKDVT